MKIRYFLTGALVLPMSIMACERSPAAPDTFETSYIAVGHEIAKENCASCHSLGAKDPSPRNDAPPLRTVLSLYNSEALADDFREHIHVGHADMPDFDFNVKETEALLAYLMSIQTP